MSDAVTQAKKRQPDRSHADDVRILADRLRSGELTYERVEWAARLGHEVALGVVGKITRPAIEWSDWWDREYAIRGVCESVAGLEFKKPIVSFAADCAERVLPFFERSRPNDDRPRKAIESARAWVTCPAPKQEAAARAAEAAAAEAEAAAAMAAAEAAAAMAAAAAAAAAARAAAAAEWDWQRLRLAAYALGEIS